MTDVPEVAAPAVVQAPLDFASAMRGVESSAREVFVGPGTSDAKLKKPHWQKLLVDALSEKWPGLDVVQTNLPVTARTDDGEILERAGHHAADIVVRLAPPQDASRMIVEVKRLARWDRKAQAHAQATTLIQRHGQWYDAQMAAFGGHPGRTAGALALVNFPLDGGAAQVERIALAEPAPKRKGARKSGAVRSDAVTRPAAPLSGGSSDADLSAATGADTAPSPPAAEAPATSGETAGGGKKKRRREPAAEE